MNFTPRVRSILALGALFLCTSTCRAQNAPNAGGYDGEFGSDYGVGKVQIKGVREAVAVVSMAARDRNGKDLPWLGLRFGQELGDKLRLPMGNSADTGGIARFLAARGTLFWDAGAWRFEAGKTSRIVALLRNQNYRRAFPLWISGEVVAKDVKLAPDSLVQIRVRAWRFEGANFRPASPVIALEAPLSDWPQLPSRAALALLDTLRVPISEDERTSFLRDASPLQPPATAARFAAERKLGTLQADALQCDIGNSVLSPAQSQKSRAHGFAARRALAEVLKIPTANTISDGDAFGRIHQNAQSWKNYVSQVSRAAELNAARRAASAKKR